MILADKITCKVATPNAVKVDLIDCSTSLIDSAKGVELMWIAIGAIGAFGAMIITIFMARYAWKAWDTARKQLEHSQSEAVLNRRQAAIVDYLRVLNRYFHDSKIGTQGLVNPSIEDVRFASDLWLLSYPKIAREDSVWKLLVSFESILARSKALNEISNHEHIGKLGEDYKSSLDEAIVHSSLQARYVLDEMNRVALELHRGEKTEQAFITSYAHLEESTDRKLRKIDAMYSV